MEALSNLASSASKAVFGEGNTTGPQPTSEEPVSGKTGEGTVNEPFDQGNAGEETQQQMQLTGEEPVSGKQGKGTVDSPYDQGNAPAVENTPVTAVGDPSSAPAPTETFQGSDRPTDEPTAGGTAALKEDKDKLDAVAANRPKAGETLPTRGETKAEGGAGGFDAAKPGATKEADRLLDTQKDDLRRDSAASAGSGGKEKTSKVAKLKEKLHIGSKKNKESLS